MHRVEPTFNFPETSATPDPNSPYALIAALEARINWLETRILALESRAATPHLSYPTPTYPNYNASTTPRESPSNE
jgi:hypothetical protein